MEVADDELDVVLGELMRQQQRELGWEMNPLILAARNQSVEVRRACLLYMYSILTTNFENYFKEDRRLRAFYLYLHRDAMRYVTGEIALGAFLRGAARDFALF
jgi:hypothetical protein